MSTQRAAEGGPGPEAGLSTRRRRVWLVLLVALLFVVGARVALPGRVARILEQQVSAALAGRLEVGDLELSLLSGRIAALDARFYGAAADAPVILSIRRLSADFHWPALLRGQLRLERVDLDAPELSIVVGPAGELNLAAFVPEDVAEAEVEEQEGDDASFSIRVETASIDDGVLRFSDARPGSSPELSARIGRLALRDLGVSHPEAPDAGWAWSLGELEAGGWHVGIGNEPDGLLRVELGGRVQGASSREERFPVRIELSGENGEVRLEGTAQLAPLAADLELQWSELQLAPFWRQASSGKQAPSASFEVRGGRSKGALRVALGGVTGEAPDLRVSGELAVSQAEVAIDDRERPAVELAVEQLALEIAELRVALPVEEGEEGEGPPAAPVVHLASLRMAGPDLRLTQQPPGEADPATPTPATADGASEPAGEAVEPVAAPAPDAAALALRVDELAVAGGRFRWSDPGLGDGFSYAVSGVSAEARDFSWPAGTFENGRLEVASLGRRPLRVEGRRDAAGGKLALDADRVALPGFNPFLRATSGYGVNRGSLSVTLDLAIAGDQYEGPLQLVFHRLQVDGEDRGGRFTRAFGVPLDAAILLLADYKGEIVLDVPVEGVAQGPRLNLLPVVVTEVRQSLVKALASPLVVVGSVVLPGRKERGMTVSLIPFRPGEGAISELAAARVENLAALLTGQEDFKARLTPRITQDDGYALASELDWADLEPARMAADHPTRRGLEALAARRLELIEQRLLEAGIARDRLELRSWNLRLEQQPPAGVQLALSRDGR